MHNTKNFARNQVVAAGDLLAETFLLRLHVNAHTSSKPCMGVMAHFETEFATRLRIAIRAGGGLANC
jgi:hypothetical protein